MDDENQIDPHPPPSKNDGSRRIVFRQSTVAIFLTVNLLLLVVLGLPYLQKWFGMPDNLPWSLPVSEPSTPTIDVPTSTRTNTQTQSKTPTATATTKLTDDHSISMDGTIILALGEGLDSHLFAVQPFTGGERGYLPLTHLTNGSWEDTNPALSPVNHQLAFSSNRGGHWDIYMLDLERGKTVQLTETDSFEASPTWSPDGLWVAYEALIDDNLEILIKPIDGSQDPIQLTNHTAADFHPAWSPAGRQIAFVSTRSGSSQIWIADLDDTGGDRFFNLRESSGATASHPAWSPDGRYLVWGAVTSDGFHNIYIWDSENPELIPKESGSGDWAVWSPDGQTLSVVLETPNQSYLTAYRMDDDLSVVIPPLKLPGLISGLVWTDGDISASLVIPDVPTPTQLWETKINVDPSGVKGRWDLMKLEDVEAPYPRLHDRVDESFQALRAKLSHLVGWDLLSDLENAYLPLSSARSPGNTEDWLYTGRAFSINTLPINAGWMVAVREDFGQKTYWRVYLRARFQDGTQGKPLDDFPWDFSARYSGRPLPYDQGGERAAAVPGGYWVDMTQIAASYGWERLPALSTWWSAYPSARFNEFVLTDGLDWVSAMLEVYPSEVLLTLTPIPTSTPTNTPAPLWYRSPVPTQSTTPTPAPTRTSPPTRTFTSTSPEVTTSSTVMVTATP